MRGEEKEREAPSHAHATHAHLDGDWNLVVCIRQLLEAARGCVVVILPRASIPASARAPPHVAAVQWEEFLL
jgi:hypothetical protein